MSYSTKYFARIPDNSGNTFTVNLKKQAYSGVASEILYYSHVPLRLQYRGGRDATEQVIFPSSVNFSFYSDSGDDYSDLLESTYKDWQLEVLRTNYSSPTYDLLFTTGATDMNQDGSGRTWSLTGGTAEVFINNTSPTSKMLYIPVDSLTDFQIVLTDIIGNGASIPSLVIQYLDAAGNIQQTKNRSLLSRDGSAFDITDTYTGTTPITRIQMYASGFFFFTGSASVTWSGVLDVYQGNSTNVLWKGWVQPDLLTSKFLTDKFFIDIEANDSIQDLKDVEYPSASATGYSRQIRVLKNAIDQTGLEDLDIQVQLNISEANSTAPLLSSIQSDTRRFIDNEDGRTKYQNCFDTIEREFEIYNTRFAQVEGKWTLTANNEVSSDIHIYDSETLTGSTLSNNREVNVTSYKVLYDSDMVSKIAPLKSAEITFQNRNISDTVIVNGDFEDGDTGWHNGTGTTESFVLATNGAGQLYMVTREPAFHMDNDVPHMFYSSPFSLEPPTTGATLTISIDAFVQSIVFTDVEENYPFIRIQLVYPDGSTQGTYQFDNAYRLTDSFKTYSVDVPIDQNGDYYVKFWVYPSESAQIDTVTVLFDNVLGTPNFEEADITFDKFTQILNTGITAVQRFQKTITFADSENTGDLGQLKYNSTGATASWSAHDGTLTNVPLMHLLGYNILRSRQRFKNYLKVTIIADTTVNFNSILTINGQKYEILGMSHDLKNSEIELDLVEFLSDPIDTSYSSYTLLTVDGKSTTGSGGGSSVTIEGVSEAEFDSTITTINNQIDDLDNRVDTIESNYVTKTVYNTFTGSTTSTLTSLDGRLDTAESDINNAESNIIALDGRIDTLESNSPITANNGLTKVGNNIVLGGSLTGNTTIGNTAASLSLNGVLRVGAAGSIHSSTQLHVQASASNGIILDLSNDSNVTKFGFYKSGIMMIHEPPAVNADSDAQVLVRDASTRQVERKPLTDFATSSDISALDLRLDSVESGVIALDSRLDTAESDILALESSMANVTSSSYTPTTYFDSNITSATVYECTYVRVNNGVHVSGMADINMAATTATLGLSVPVPLTYSAIEQAAGVANSNVSASDKGYIQASGANGGRVQLFLIGGTGSKRFFFQFTYRLT